MDELHFNEILIGGEALMLDGDAILHNISTAVVLVDHFLGDVFRCLS